MASSLSSIVAKDGTPATIVGGILAIDKSGAGTGPFFSAVALVDTQGVNTSTVKAASTAAVVGDTALVVAVSPNNTVAVTQATAASLNATVVGTGTFVTQSTVTQATAASLNATVVGTGTFAVQATLQATPATAIGKVDPNTIGNWGLQVSTQNSATPTNGCLMLAQFNTSPTTITTGNVSPFQVDNAGNLLVNVKAGGGTGGTSAVDEAAFTEGTSSYTPIGGTFKTSQTALTSGQGGAVALSAAREMNCLGKIWDGTNTAAVKAASTAPLTTDPALVVAISPNSVNANGQAVMASSAPVVIASNQSAIPVNPSAAATGGATNLHFFSVTGTPTATAIKASAGTLYGVQAINTGAAPVYVKLYNTASGSVTVGTTVPLITIPVPTVATTGAGVVIPFPVGVVFGTAISYAITNVAADNDATAVAVGTTLNVQFA